MRIVLGHGAYPVTGLVNFDDAAQRLSMQMERLLPGDPRLGDTLDLIRRVFSEHDGRIDPPSSMHRMTAESLSEAARDGELWVIGQPPRASVLFELRPATLYLSKLAVAREYRGRGLARSLVELAGRRALALGLSALEVQTRVELTDNHAAFRAMGFVRTADYSHPGYEKPTSVTMRKIL